MYAELEMEIEGDLLDYRKSSGLQGVIMEHIDSAYAGRLHESRLNPYSQFLVRKGEKKLWYIRTVNQEAYEKLLLPMAALEGFELKKGKINVQVLRRRIETCSEAELMREFYQNQSSHYLNVQFLTPTAFKQSGRYIVYPDLALLYGSLMRKYSAASNELDMVDEEALEQLVLHSDIVEYRLKTLPFPLEGVKLHGFVGSLCIHMRGTDTMANYVRMLLKFGSFSGAGIKTGMGMGAMEFVERRKEQ